MNAGSYLPKVLSSNGKKQVRGNALIHNSGRKVRFFIVSSFLLLKIGASSASFIGLQGVKDDEKIKRCFPGITVFCGRRMRHGAHRAHRDGNAAPGKVI